MVAHLQKNLLSVSFCVGPPPARKKRRLNLGFGGATACCPVRHGGAALTNEISPNRTASEEP